MLSSTCSVIWSPRLCAKLSSAGRRESLAAAAAAAPFCSPLWTSCSPLFPTAPWSTSKSHRKKSNRGHEEEIAFCLLGSAMAGSHHYHTPTKPSLLQVPSVSLPRPDAMPPISSAVQTVPREEELSTGILDLSLVLQSFLVPSYRCIFVAYRNKICVQKNYTDCISKSKNLEQTMPSTSLATRKRERRFCFRKVPRSREKSLQGVWIFLIENSEQHMEALSQKATRTQPHSVGRGHEQTNFRAYLCERDRRGTWEWKA